jgi:hypothetical protein
MNMASDSRVAKVNSSTAGPAEGEISQDLRLTASVDDQKPHLAGHKDYHGIDTTQVQPGADAAYEAKITILNEALIDIGMGPFQWKIFLTTGFGWFIDNVC